jgi:hypothetical protein
MALKIVNIALLVAAVTGFAMTLSVFGERSRLITEYENYVAKVGRLKVEEPEKIYVKRIVTDIPDHFAWRVYLPRPNSRGLVTRIFNGADESGASFTHPTGDTGNEATIRVTFRRTDKGVAASFGSALSKLRDDRVTKFIKQHWDDLRFEIAAKEDTLVQEGDEVIKLLVVTLPKRLADKFVAEHGEEFSTAIERPFSFYHGYKGAKGWP